MKPSEKPKKELAVVLLSGGMDSAVTAAIANESHRPALLHVSYGQQGEARERRAFKAIADYYKADTCMTCRLDHLKRIGHSSLTDERMEN